VINGYFFNGAVVFKVFYKIDCAFTR